MLLLFVNLYLAMFTGTWANLNWAQVSARTKPCLNTIGTFLTSIFGDTSFNDLGNIITQDDIGYALVAVISLVLALITSIGIVVMAVKGIKRIFAVFFTFGR